MPLGSNSALSAIDPGTRNFTGRASVVEAIYYTQIPDSQPPWAGYYEYRMLLKPCGTQLNPFSAYSTTVNVTLLFAGAT